MGIKVTQERAAVICKMDEHLRVMLQENPDKLWENTFINRQIVKRNNNGLFSVSDHIRAMAYSMLSGGQAWNKYVKEADAETKCITGVDRIFHDYKPTELLECTPKQLFKELQEIHLEPRFGLAPIEALLYVNVPKLLKLEKEYGSIDNYYCKYIQIGIDHKYVVTARPLIETLSNSKSVNKLEQMGIPLVCEYLRNVGYDLPKPDTHIRRILGRDILGFSTSREVSEYRAIEIVYKIAKVAHKSVAETDYILWSYCSDGYGEICTSANPKCDKCVAMGQCRKHMDDAVTMLKNKYVLASHYKLKENDGVSEIISKTADIAYLPFCRRIFLRKEVSLEEANRLNHEVGMLLAVSIPELLESTDQKMFDEIHHKICEKIIHIYNQVCDQSYGIAQRWLNETLINLIVVESSLSISRLPVKNTRKYFHVPVGNDLLKVATVKGKEGYHFGLGLKCAPVKHENFAGYEMEWFRPGETQSFEKWEYSEYIEFQNAIRDVLKKPIKDGCYKDVIDWGLYVLLEISKDG